MILDKECWDCICLDGEGEPKVNFKWICTKNYSFDKPSTPCPGYEWNEVNDKPWYEYLVTIKCPKCGDVSPREIEGVEHPITCVACKGKFWPPFYHLPNGDVQMYTSPFGEWVVNPDGYWERKDL